MATINQTLYFASQHQRTILLHYNSPSEGITQREVDIYRINNTYLGGYCHLTKEIRVFRIDRIVGVELTDNQYTVNKSLWQQAKKSHFFPTTTIRTNYGYRSVPATPLKVDPPSSPKHISVPNPDVKNHTRIGGWVWLLVAAVLGGILIFSTSAVQQKGSYSNTAADTPAPATAICVDGHTSYSANHQGTCSHHGGVREWLR